MNRTGVISLKNGINFEKVYFYLILVFALTVPLVRASISLFMILLPVIWIIEGDFKRKFEDIKSSKLLMALLLYLIFSILSILWSSNLDTALNILRKSTYLFTIFVIATSLKKEYVVSVITAFLVGMFISEIIAYGVFFEIWTFKNATPQNPTPVMQHIDYSIFMAFSAILLLNRIFSKHYIAKEKVIFIIFFLTVTGNMFLSIGRTGQVAFIAGIIVMTIIHFRVSIKSFVLSSLMIVTIFTSAYHLSASFESRSKEALNNVEKILNSDLNSSWGIRVAYWITTYNIFKENPLIGVGLGDYIDETRDELKDDKYSYLDNSTIEFMSNYHPHNQYLLVLLQMGIIGLFLLFYFIFLMLRQKIDNPEIKELSILFVTVFFVGCIAEPLLLKQFPLALFVLFIGIFSIYSIPEKLK